MTRFETKQDYRLASLALAQAKAEAELHSVEVAQENAEPGDHRAWADIERGYWRERS